MSKFFVFCPGNIITGGPDALHQMVYYMNKHDIEAEIVYCDINDDDFEIPKQYQIYLNRAFTCNTAPITENDYIIVTETLIRYTEHFNPKGVIVWWLSVDNNLNKTSLPHRLFFMITLPIRYFFQQNIYKNNFSNIVKYRWLNRRFTFKNESFIAFHICASYYALDYVKKRSKRPVYKCIEPISLLFLQNYKKMLADNIFSNIEKEDIIIYNPVKSGVFVDKLKKYDKKHTYIKLEKLSQEELINYYQKAKIYIDFGPFPGAERMPKEAVLYNCCILTGKNGASAYYGDVPIKDEYKFADYNNQIDEIISKIDELLQNYESKISDFDDYKNTVLRLEENFENSLEEIFKKFN